MVAAMTVGDCLVELGMMRMLGRVMLLLLPLSYVAAGPTTTVAPAEDERALLHNPDMGWVVYENYPVDPQPNASSTLASLPEDNFDGVDAAAIMFAWSDVEAVADRYDFSKVD